jgi:hypothetical protein
MLDLFSISNTSNETYRQCNAIELTVEHDETAVLLVNNETSDIYIKFFKNEHDGVSPSGSSAFAVGYGILPFRNYLKELFLEQPGKKEIYVFKGAKAAKSPESISCKDAADYINQLEKRGADLKETDKGQEKKTSSKEAGKGESKETSKFSIVFGEKSQAPDTLSAKDKQAQIYIKTGNTASSLPDGVFMEGEYLLYKDILALIISAKTGSERDNSFISAICMIERNRNDSKPIDLGKLSDEKNVIISLAYEELKKAGIFTDDALYESAGLSRVVDALKCAVARNMPPVITASLINNAMTEITTRINTADNSMALILSGNAVNLLVYAKEFLEKQKSKETRDKCLMQFEDSCNSLCEQIRGKRSTLNPATGLPQAPPTGKGEGAKDVTVDQGTGQGQGK